MTVFCIGSTKMNKWLHQNKAQYTGAYCEGCLLDNFMVETKRGVAAIYEHYLNPNSSDYLVKFVPFKGGVQSGELDRLMADWYSFYDAVMAEMGV